MSENGALSISVRNGDKPEDVPDPLTYSLETIYGEAGYLNLVRRVLREGVQRQDRTGTGTWSIFGPQIRFNLRSGDFPLLTTKQMFFRGILEELLWFIQGATDSRKLTEKKVFFWDTSGSRAFLDQQGFVDREEDIKLNPFSSPAKETRYRRSEDYFALMTDCVGPDFELAPPSRPQSDVGPVYGFQWRHAGAEYTDYKHDYTGEGVDQLAEVIKRIKEKPWDRRLLIVTWNARDLHKMILPPCPCLVQFYVANGELSCMVYHRSGDMGLVVPFNIASYALLMLMIAHITGLKPGDFVHTLGDCHVYTTHKEALKKQLKRVPRPFPRLVIKRQVTDIDDFKAEDFEVVGYKPYPKIPMKMAG